MENRNYAKFAFMLCMSFIVMYSVMYLNVATTDHVYWSLNRFYMTVLMVAPMAWIMLTLMGGMYKNRRLNTVIVALSAVAFVGAFALLRNQTFVGDVQFMKSMIPHHSSAILVSRKAAIRDPEVKQLAEEIIASQEEEIARMKRMLERLGE